MNKEDFTKNLLDQHTSKWKKVWPKTYIWIEKILKTLESPWFEFLHYKNFDTFNEYEKTRKEHNLKIKKRKMEIKIENDWFDNLLWHAKNYAHKKMSEKSIFLWEKFNEY